MDLTIHNYLYRISTVLKNKVRRDVEETHAPEPESWRS